MISKESALNTNYRNEFEYELVTSTELRKEIYKLRYRCYRKDDLIDKSSNEVFSDEYDECKNVLNYALYVNGELIGAIRLHFLTSDAQSSPSLVAFEREITPWLSAGKRIIDPTRFVLDASALKIFKKAPVYLLRIPFMAACHYAADIALASVRDRHMSFYKRVLYYEKVADPHPYPGLKIPLGLMSVSYPEKNALVTTRYSEFLSTTNERNRVFPASKGCMFKNNSYE